MSIWWQQTAWCCLTVISIRVTTCRPFSARTATGRLGRALSIALSAGVLWRSAFYSFFARGCASSRALPPISSPSLQLVLSRAARRPPPLSFSPPLFLTLACSHSHALLHSFSHSFSHSLALALALALAFAPMHAPPHTTTIQEKIYKRQINKQSRAARAVDSWQVVRHDSFIRVT